ncbi:MAG: hypothetical protein ABWZ02_06450 [Nakamurella sp.]
MPSIAELDVPPSPRDDPLSYPGMVPPHSYLWADSWMYQLAWQPEIELCEWRLAVDGGPLGDCVQPADRLDDARRTPRGAQVTQRYPVLAFGSNAAPAQLLDKFDWLAPRHRVVPVTVGQLDGFSLAHSAHVSNPGYLPYVLVHAGAGATLEVRVLWLDDTQLAALNETEPNYRLVPVNGERYLLTLESGATVPRYSAYRGSWGALRWPAEQLPAAARAQAAMHAELARCDWFADLLGRVGVSEQVELLRADKALRDRVRDELAARGMAVADGWIAD